MLVALAALAGPWYFRFSAALRWFQFWRLLETSLVIVETHDSETSCCSGQSSNAKNNQHYGKSLFEGHNSTQRIMPKLPDWNLTWNHRESQKSPSERIDLWYSPYKSKKQRPFQCPNMSEQLGSQLLASRRKPRNSRLWPAVLEWRPIEVDAETWNKVRAGPWRYRSTGLSPKLANNWMITLWIS